MKENKKQSVSTSGSYKIGSKSKAAVPSVNKANKSTKLKVNLNDALGASGGRKEATARALLSRADISGKGVFTVKRRGCEGRSAEGRRLALMNKHVRYPVENYFTQSNVCKLKIPFDVVGLNYLDWNVHLEVSGGGKTGQAEAGVLALSKALVLLNPELKAKLSLTRDARCVERKKYGRKKARKNFQFSKR